jgi:pectate lyase
MQNEEYSWQKDGNDEDGDDDAMQKITYITVSFNHINHRNFSFYWNCNFRFTSLSIAGNMSNFLRHSNEWKLFNTLNNRTPPITSMQTQQTLRRIIGPPYERKSSMHSRNILFK